MEVLYEDNHLLAVMKPALLPTMGVTSDRPSLLATAKEYLRVKCNKPGNVYLGVVSRLDAPVTGVVLLARTSKAARRLNEQFRKRTVSKTYWALVEGMPPSESGTLEHYLRHDDRHRRVHVTHAAAAGAKFARLRYRVIGRKGSVSHLEVEPETGRKHQIRVQLAALGNPILGDRKYGSKTLFPTGIALHARKLVVEHPTGHFQVELVAAVPRAWSKSGIDF